MRPVVIFGAGQVAQVFAEYLDSHLIPVAGFMVDPEYVPEKIPARLTLSSGINPVFRPDLHDFVIGMSFRGLNKPRAAKFQWMLEHGYSPCTHVHNPTLVAGSAGIGPGSFILDQNVIQPFVEIGKNCILWSGNHIGHHTTIGDHVFIASHAVIGGDCSIGDRCFIGVNATIRDGVNIGADCVIGAGALILSDCEAGGVYGAPATERSRVPSHRLKGI